MTEALIGNLARIQSLRVVSRTSVMRFKGAGPPLADIARTLNVDAVLEGSVQQSGDRVRVSLQLIHAATDAHLWARAYERELTDVLKLQSEVARAVADEVQDRVTAEERARLASTGPVSAAAYQEFLLGQHYLWRLTEEDLARAIGHFEQSVRLDPSYAAAYAGLSHAWWWRGIWGDVGFKQVRAPSRAAAAKALELDPGLAEAHVSLGRINSGTNGTGAAPARRLHGPSRSIRTTPTRTSFRPCCAWRSGAFPRPSITCSGSRRSIRCRRRCSRSLAGSCIGRAVRRGHCPSQPGDRTGAPEPGGAYVRLADVYEAMGRYDEALALLEKDARLEGRAGPTMRTARAARIFALMGKRQEAMEILGASRGDNPHMRAMAYAAVGDTDEAFRLLFGLVEDPDFNVYVKTDPALDPLRSDPRWNELLRRMNYPKETPAGSPDLR